MDFKPTSELIAKLAHDNMVSIELIELNETEILLSVNSGRVSWNFESCYDNLKEEIDESLESIREEKEFNLPGFLYHNLQNIYNFFKAFKNSL